MRELPCRAPLTRRLASLVVALPLGLVWLALLSAGLGGCGGDGGIVVSVENWPATSPYLLVETRVDGSPGQTLRIPAGQRRFVVRLRSGQTGELALAGFAIDDSGCKVAQGQLVAVLQGGLRRTGEGTLSLSPLDPVMCPLTVDIPAGGGLVKSTPAGLECPTGTICQGEFPRLSAVKLTPVPGSYRRYAEWLDGCSGNRDCNVITDKKVSLKIQFKDYACSADGWCVRPLKVGSVPLTKSLRTLRMDSTGGVWIAGDNTSGANSTIAYCDKLSCEWLNAPVSINGALRNYQSVVLDDYFFTLTDRYDSFSCSRSGCTIFENFYYISPYLCGTYVAPADGYRLYADGGYIWMYALFGGSSDKNKIFRLSHTLGRLNKCDTAYTLPMGTTSGVADFYVKDGTLWVVDQAGDGHVASCSPGLPCVEGTLSPTISGVRTVTGLGPEVWFAGSNTLRRCNNATRSCESASRALPNLGTSPFVTITNNSVWGASEDYVGYLNGYQAMNISTMRRSLTGLPVPLSGLLSTQWFWGDERSLFLAAAGPLNLEVCDSTLCRKQDLAAPGLVPSLIHAVTGDGQNIWAVGENGTILHYQRP